MQSRWAGASASPKQTVAGSTVVASKEAVVRMATGMTPPLDSLIGLVSVPGLTSMVTRAGAGVGVGLGVGVGVTTITVTESQS